MFTVWPPTPCFQAESQPELENWVTAVHSACASLLARQHGKADALRLLRSQTHGLLQKVDMDGKMKKMAELQLSVVNDQKNRKAIESQVMLGWGGGGREGPIKNHVLQSYHARR